MITIRMLQADEGHLLDNQSPGIFDDDVDPTLIAEFCADPRHHLAVALSDDNLMVGMASGLHYVHPDKRTQLFINEVGVADAFQGQGIGKRLLAVLLEHARSLNCTEAWVLTEPDNLPALGLYRSVGTGTSESAAVMFTFPLEADS
jgi:ribosomal protein S18 acetylase RimI-like enzyme